MFTQDRPHVELFFGVPVLFIVFLLCFVTSGTRWAMCKFGPLMSSLIAYLPSALAQAGEAVVVISLLVAVSSNIAAAWSLTHPVANEHMASFYWFTSIIVDICGLSVLGLAVVLLVEVFTLGRLPDSPESLAVARLMHQLVGLGTRGAYAARSFNSKHWPASLFRKAVDPVLSLKDSQNPARQSGSDRTGSMTTTTALYKTKNSTHSSGRLEPEGFGPWDSLGI
ncbi:hypothetical protein LTR37_011872 [Vermiconidia calcicola]|uniref:Uncharacterized protein n=1 Tax=Vermiconidia calcicola TaxID=1690605 RepID=A0ACC3N3U7_9PEZI|nr:hypothetical protein LTR37_011872 [Vermiconidia calcicola]